MESYRGIGQSEQIGYLITVVSYSLKIQHFVFSTLPLPCLQYIQNGATVTFLVCAINYMLT